MLFRHPRSQQISTGDLFSDYWNIHGSFAHGSSKKRSWGGVRHQRGGYGRLEDLACQGIGFHQTWTATIPEVDWISNANEAVKTLMLAERKGIRCFWRDGPLVQNSQRWWIFLISNAPTKGTKLSNYWTSRWTPPTVKEETKRSGQIVRRRSRKVHKRFVMWGNQAECQSPVVVVRIRPNQIRLRAPCLQHTRPTWLRFGNPDQLQRDKENPSREQYTNRRW